ncbi:MAG: hypothetical protein FWC47_04680 [Oscillospiraceae bacterium]|nr:hypothetical protein [Oscillospiraceae bacterium]
MPEFKNDEKQNFPIDEYTDIKIYLENKKNKRLNWKRIMTIILTSIIIVSFIVSILYAIIYYNFLI